MNSSFKSSIPSADTSTLAHTDAGDAHLRWRAEVNKHLGVRSELIYPDEIRKLCRAQPLDDVRYPILGALYHRPGGRIARHDAVAWGYAVGAARARGRAARRPKCSPSTWRIGKVTEIVTSRGNIRCGIAHASGCGIELRTGEDGRFQAADPYHPAAGLA
jgi:sarcosine oxidase subunit beta